MDLFEISFYVLIALFIVVIGGLTIWGFHDLIIWIRNKLLRYEEFDDYVKVVNKKFKDEDTTVTFIPAGNAMIPQTHIDDEEFNVYVTYKGNDYCFDDKELFNSIEIGNIILAHIHIGYNKKNVAKRTILTIVSS